MDNFFQEKETFHVNKFKFDEKMVKTSILGSLWPNFDLNWLTFDKNVKIKKVKIVKKQ